MGIVLLLMEGLTGFPASFVSEVPRADKRVVSPLPLGPCAILARREVLKENGCDLSAKEWEFINHVGIPKAVSLPLISLAFIAETLYGAFHEGLSPRNAVSVFELLSRYNEKPS